MSTDAIRALRVLADLAPSGESDSKVRHTVTDRVLVPLDAVRFLHMPMGARTAAPLETGDQRGAIVDLVKRARLLGEEADLRAGWLWLTTPGTPTPMRTPLVSARVAATVSGGDGILGTTMFSTIALARTGDIELTELIHDEAATERLEDDIAFGGGELAGHADVDMPPELLGRLTELIGWATAAAEAAGFPGVRVVATEPDTLDEPVVVAQLGLYLRERPQASAGSVAQSLSAWSRAEVRPTAFAALYDADVLDDPDDAAATGDERADEVVSSIVLSPAQQSAVRNARTARTTVVSGPPGSGKTQAVAATALDVVEHGGSVLVAAPSHAAVEALVTLLTNAPGPDPVVFGDTARRVEVADRLGQGGGDLVDRRAVAQAREEYARADADHRAQLAGIVDVLDAERAAGSTDPVRTFRARQVAPAWFEPGADLATAAGLLDRANAVSGWFADFRRRRALERLQSHAGAPTAALEQLADAIATARAERAAVQLVAAGGLDLDVDGLIGEYLRYATEPPGGPLGTAHADAEIAGLATDLRRAGLEVVTNYPAGRHVVDLVVGEGQTALAVTFGVHTDGPLAHVERELALRHFGWSTMDVFATRWDDRLAELALELARKVRTQASSDASDQA